MTFMARFSRGSTRSPVRPRGSLEEMPAVQHPFLNVFELERLLYTGKTACNHADEVWPGLYLGDQYVRGTLGPWLDLCVCVCVWRRRREAGRRQVCAVGSVGFPRWGPRREEEGAGCRERPWGLGERGPDGYEVRRQGRPGVPGWPWT